MALVDGQPGQPEPGELAPDLARVPAGLGDRVPALEGEGLVDPARDGLAQRVLFVGEVEVHGQLPSTVCATILRCTSLDPP